MFASYYPKAWCSTQSSARRLAPPLFLPAASLYHEVLTVAQLDKADAACDGADAARPDEGICHAALRLFVLRFLSPPRPLASFCAGTAPNPVGGAAGRDETPAAHSAPTRRATATWTKRCAFLRP
jgi:hypothetical protein